MRVPRIKVSPLEGAALYHCISRTVNGERLFADADCEMFRRMMWQVAEFCGVEVVTYAILSNHFHILVRVPEVAAVSDAELLRRYRVLHPQPTKYQTAKLAVLASKLTVAADVDGQRWRQRQLALMGDVSQFMKLLKQRFSIWFNRAHQRFGTLWSERFKSVLVEHGAALRVMAAYIDLNPIRAGLAADPKDYRFCGYAEAVAGNQRLRQALTVAFEQTDWNVAHNYYRQLLFGSGGEKKHHAASLSAARAEEVIAEQGALSVAELLRCRAKYFTDGAVLGGKVFVSNHLRRYRQVIGSGKQSPPRNLPAAGDYDELTVLRGGRAAG
ncbi:MAG: transposase [Verrucomicrobiales bacterium]|jgi:REP element-mobilizing transposase RayT|nr:transposase [Verrucomicrobiales bacterium]